MPVKEENRHPEEEEIIEEEETEELEEEPEGEESEDDEESDEEKPFWLKDDDDEGEQDPSDSVPEASLIKVKQKLKGKIRERDAELEKLRSEIEALKKSGSQGSISPSHEAPKRPRLSDFESDEDYEEAMDKYEEEKLVYQQQFIAKNQNQEEAIKKRQQKVERAVEDHYDRAAKLVEKEGISPEAYQKANSTVQDIIDEVMPNSGEAVFNELVHLVGDGSEKTMFFVGRNKNAQQEFRNLLQSDTTGLSAAFHLGKITERISGTKKSTSRAPAPAPNAAGEAASSTKASALKKKYSDAHKKGNAQKAYELKQQAKKAGVDTSTWS